MLLRFSVFEQLGVKETDCLWPILSYSIFPEVLSALSETLCCSATDNLSIQEIFWHERKEGQDV